ncbi:unnamed protein product [Echinostoma caproni]|uniref:UBA domain-containing protein n=1 Tax=Echinostoma caproni TaxID=27848 RepID=A0A182ZZF5_9TREM|nr:unnamed protein product [Echinostoma caproni]
MLPSGSSMLQPMDQGVIWSSKCSVGKHSLEYVLSFIVGESLIVKVEVKILLVKHLVKKARVFVHPHELIKALMNVGFKSTLIQSVMQPPEYKCDLIEEFTHHVSIDKRLFEEVSRLEFDEDVGYLKLLYQVSFIRH